MEIGSLIDNGIFAAIAAVGFGSISNVSAKSFIGCALLAAVGHTFRFILMNGFGWFIISASFVGAISIGVLSVFLSRKFKCPAEGLSYPALLPMIPGMYAYRSVHALIMCFLDGTEATFTKYFETFNYNWAVCVFTIGLMVVGVTIPIFIFKSKSFSATR